MRARSFKQWTETREAQHLNMRVTIYQTLESLHWLYKFGVGLYNVIQKYYPRFHHIYFNYLEASAQFRRADQIKGQQKFIEKLEEVRPELIISTHAHLNHGFFELARNTLGRDNVKCVTYCGELHGGYGFSRHWVNPEADLFIGAVEETCDMAKSLGMDDEKAWPGGFMLNPAFYQTKLTEDEKKAFIRNRLGLDPDRFILLLGTGANGANNHMRLLKALSESSLVLQVVVLCSRNKACYDYITKWAKKYPRLTVKPLGYFTEMGSLLQCVSTVVARSGTGLTSEAIISQCPVLFNGMGGVMPQERITLEFCRKHKLGVEIKRPTDMIPYIKRWIESPKKLDVRRLKKERKRPKNSPIDILEKLNELVYGPDTDHKNVTPFKVETEKLSLDEELTEQSKSAVI
jgi:processive 1,2-diacylglycerol beta-glucosyltransferase